jgi:hypothetical protein
MIRRKEEEEEGREEGEEVHRRSTSRNANGKSRRNESGLCVFGAWIMTLRRHSKTCGSRTGRSSVSSPEGRKGRCDVPTRSWRMPS